MAILYITTHYLHFSADEWHPSIKRFFSLKSRLAQGIEVYLYEKQNIIVIANKFIFSNKLKYRLTRHLAFWAIYYLRTVLLYLPDVKINTLTDPRLYLYALHDGLDFLPIYLFSVYVSLYFVLPKFLARRNILFLLVSSLILISISLLAAYFISIAIFEKSGEPWSQLDVITQAFFKCRGHLIAITSAAVIIKIMKDYSFRQRENEVLAIENVRNKLRLIKIKMHPRILFECLHNIYTDIDAGTVFAPEMILKLSELLSYLLYEGELQQVPLMKEVNMIQNYIELKKLGLKNKLEIYFDVTGEMGIYYITPVLFLPLLEVGIVPFENQEKQLSVFIEFKTSESKLYFSLKSNIPGTQIKNVLAVQETLDNTKRRLQISHLHRYKFEVHYAVDSFEIMLQLEPDKIICLEDPNIQNGESLIYEHA